MFAEGTTVGEGMQKLDKKGDSDIQDHELVLATYLVQYYRNSFDIRSEGLLMATVDPPEVRELVNMLQWIGDGFGLLDIAEHALGLSDVINESATEMRALISYVREFGANQQMVKEINYLQEQMEAADTLMEYITDG